MITIGWLLIAAYWTFIFVLVAIWEPRDNGRWR